jgi:hypothetical protein
MKEAGGRRLFPGLLQETAAAHVPAKLTGIRMAGVFPDTGVGGLSTTTITLNNRTVAQPPKNMCTRAQPPNFVPSSLLE